MEQRPVFPEYLERVLARLHAAGVRVYVVGGALRDTLLGREPRDFDLVVDHELEAVRRALPEAVTISAHTPLLLIPESVAGLRIEISVRRAGARSLEEDLCRRDFSLNAIAFDPQSGSYLDPLDGRGDLASRRLRAVDTERAFRDDAIRILRGVRLSLELELEIDPETERSMERESWRLHSMPGERRRDELMRLLALPRPSRGIEQLRAIGALDSVLPELLREVGVAQNRHHPDDVYRHTLRVCDGLRDDPLLRLAALLHDASKPETKYLQPKSNDFTFHRHDLLGVAHARSAAKRLRLSKQERSRLERLVRQHLLYPDRLDTDRAIRRMLRRAGRDILPGLLELRRADYASRDPQGRVPADWEAAELRIRALERETRRTSPRRLAIGGKEIMRELGISEGPLVGRWLTRTRRLVLERPEENERERLLTWLRESAASE